MMTFFRHRKRGFTLIELLVVISVIGFLSSVVMSTASIARSKTRNTQRASGIRQLQNAIAIARSNNINMPPPANLTLGACVSDTCWGWNPAIPQDATVNAFLALGTNKKPSDTQNPRIATGGYIYNYWAGGTGYDDVYFPPGYIVLYTQEPPVTATSCSPGKVYNVFDPYYIGCFLYVE